MDIKLAQIIFQIINFGVVAVGLTYLLYKPVSKILDERAKKAEEAERAYAEAAKKQAELDELKANAKKDAEKESFKIVAEAKKDADAVKKQLLEDAKKEALSEKEKQMKAFKDEQNSMLTQMQKEFGQSVFAVAENVVGKLDKKQHEALIDQAIKDLKVAVSK